ncbi:MAG: transport-associated protein [Desulfuromonas sp.]|nr:MAG: transport-associated protein [Desulfuromonas sp.]
MAIITISREMGSGGIPIAHKTAEKLGYTMVDGDKLRELAPQYGLSQEALEKADEKPPAFIDALDHQLEIDQHLIELIILDHALKGNVIIYGRGGQDLLAGISSVLRVRIIAPFEERVERWAEREWLDPELARILVRKSDQQRAGFIKYYFDRDWEDPLHYDLLINTARLSEESAVELIADAIKDQNLEDNKQNGKAYLSDLILRKKAEIALRSDPRVEAIKMGHFNVSVANSIAHVEGHVHSNEEKQAVEDLVLAVEGIQSLNSKLQVRQYRNYPREH